MPGLDEDAGLYTFPVARMGDNRLQGLLREIAEAIEEEGDAARLRTFSQSLNLLAGRSRSRAYDLSADPNKKW